MCQFSAFINVPKNAYWFFAFAFAVFVYPMEPDMQNSTESVKSMQNISINFK